jgi:hypothetical protein
MSNPTLTKDTRDSFEAQVQEALDEINLSEIDGMFTVACTFTPSGVAASSTVHISIPKSLSQQAVLFMCEALLIEVRRITAELTETFCHEGPLQ